MSVPVSTTYIPSVFHSPRLPLLPTDESDHTLVGEGEASRIHLEPGVASHACNPSSSGMETGHLPTVRSGVSSQPWLHRVTLSLKDKQNNYKTI